MAQEKHTYSPDFTDEEFEKFCKFMHQTDTREYGYARAKVLGYDVEGLNIAPGVIISKNPRMSFGKGVRISQYTYVSGATKIGDHVLIGPNCSLAGGNHKFNAEKGWFADRSEKDQLETSIEIGDGSWLCSNVVVVAGVKVGKCNLICAGAVVTKDTEDYAIMAGVPAKKIGHIDKETGEYIYGK
ncbi:MAG: acyltransferase [Clostridia bacterium]|nr:acyltransferase [Clostridia bacterium]